MSLNFGDLLDGLRVLWLVESTKDLLHNLAAVHPLLQQGLGRRLLGLSGLNRLHRCLAAGNGLGLRSIRLSLAALGLLVGSRGRRASGATVVVVDTLHVVSEVPLARKTISGDSTLTSFIHAQEGLVTMTMKTVRLTLMTEEAGSRGEASTLAGLGLATVRLQVGVNKFAVSRQSY